MLADALMSQFKYLSCNLFLALLVAVAILGPDIVLSLQRPDYTPLADRRVLAVTVLLGWLLLNGRPKFLCVILFGLLSLVQLTELLHLSYFGVFYGPSEMYLLGSDFEEIVQSLVGMFGFFVRTFLVWLVFFAIGMVVLLRTRRLQYGSFIVSGLLLLALVNPAYNALRRADSSKIEPESARPALVNGLNAISFFIVRSAPDHADGKRALMRYDDYRVQAIQPLLPYHVVVYLGESLAPSHMGLFGYERDTTPFLKLLAQEPHTTHGVIVSGAVTTRVSIATFMNVQYAPDDYGHLAGKSTNLFRLAKRAGLQTALLSVQKLDGISSVVARNEIDVWEDYFSVEKRYPDTYDDRLVSLLETSAIDWSKPAFVILNPRSAHAPYQAAVPPGSLQWSVGTSRQDTHRYMSDSYDDAMAYADQTLRALVTSLQKISPIPVALVIMSDHGERLGETGSYGHNTLDYTTTATPLLLTTLNSPSPIPLAGLSALGCIRNHYDLAKLVARLLGYGIDNPNEIPGQYFVNGNDVLGRAGYVSYSPADLPSRYGCVDVAFSIGSVANSR